MNLRFPVIALAIGLQGVAGPLSADAPRYVADYTLTSWGTDLVPPGFIRSMVQDELGYIWIGTDAGLIRFDGVRFVEWTSDGAPALPGSSAQSLFVSRDGDLWIGFGSGEISRVRKGRSLNYGERDGLPVAPVRALEQDSRGTMWAGTTNGLFRLEGERWQRVAVGDQPSAPVHTIGSAGGSGGLLLSTSHGVYRHVAGTDTFRRVESYEEPGLRIDAIVEDRNDAVWLTDPIIGFRKLGTSRDLALTPGPAQGFDLTLDRSGNLWIAMGARGLWRLRLAGDGGETVFERAGTISARFVMEDREGNIWAAGGPDGLHRFAAHKVRTLEGLGLVEGIGTAPDGTLWVSTGDDLVAFDLREPVPIEEGRWPIAPRAMHVDRLGQVWAVTRSRLFRVAGGRPSEVLRFSEGLGHRVSSITSDGHGGIWVFFVDHEPLHWNGGRTTPLKLPAGIGRDSISTYTDSENRLWIATLSGRLDVIEPDGRIRSPGRGDSLVTGPYSAIMESADHTIWVGGVGGLSGLTPDGQLLTVTPQNGLPTGVVEVAEDSDGTLWLGTRSGIVRLARSEVSRVAEAPSHQVRFVLYDISDGLAGLPLGRQGRKAVRDDRGQLWFVTSEGLTIVDPRSLSSTTPAPVVARLEEMIVDGVGSDISALESVRLPSATTMLQVNFTAFGLASPQKLRFRYQLEGFDDRWVESGTRRQAYYTNLAPGRYRFRVAASRVGGDWHEAPRAWSFTVAPPFYRTWWFYGGSTFAFLTSILALWHIRSRQMREHFALVLGERVRLSREIHDTLLQSLVGVSLQFEGMSRRLDGSSEAGGQLLGIRRQIEEHIREARQSIWNLRSPALERHDLVDALRIAGARAAAGSSTNLEIFSTGPAVRLETEVEEQLLRIGQEAITNALRHAQPSTIRVEVTYGEAAIGLRVSDDGCGFDPVHQEQDPAGHYGLMGMRERAWRIGGRCTIIGSQSGTVVDVTVPRRRAWNERLSRLLPFPLFQRTGAQTPGDSTRLPSN